MIRIALIAILFIPAAGRAGDAVDRKQDVIYGRKHGMALTLDVFTPKEKNGLGVIWVVSGGWFSSHAAINPGFIREFTDRGYTVFAVVHGSQPKFTIPEILDDMHRAVRFVRHSAKHHGIDPEKIGIFGGSAGGHLSLMQGTGGRRGDVKSKDIIDGLSSRVQAVACFFPPTDFLNYGKDGEEAIGTGVLKGFPAPFDFHKLVDKSYVPITDPEERRTIGRAISPAHHVTKETPPTLIIHGDADKLVPIQQAELFVKAADKVGATAKLVRREGQGHGWKDLPKDLSLFADWFDQHLKSPKR